ncbi:hypothetical protein O181_049402 [Austropuccinia psidii MF-1]|uniref:Uncharacterized protein n=1 Tax=Austropuccinia psidii MF-1 TaxID=1389203 RepID=A0A9Q3E1Q8_9BASI|nr:hypothetical protein [Austropuccinia psidii MF-1]
MSSKLTELTESSPSALPPSVLCGLASSVNCLHPPWLLLDILILPKHMKATMQLRPLILLVLRFWQGARISFNTKILDLQSAITVILERGHVVIPGCQLLIPVPEEPTPDGTSGYSHLTVSRKRDVARWTNVGGPIPVFGRPIYSSSEVQISRINTEGVVKRIRRISDSPTDPDAEGSDDLAGGEFVVVPHSKFPTVLASIATCLTPASPSPSHARPALNQAVRPSPNQKPRNSPITTSQQLQPMASSSRRRDGLAPLPFPAAQVFQRRDGWPIPITREDPNGESENQEAVARLFRRVDKNSREVIMYANDRTIPGTVLEEMAAKFSWYEDELINDFKRSFDDLCET